MNQTKRTIGNVFALSALVAAGFAPAIACGGGESKPAAAPAAATQSAAADTKPAPAPADSASAASSAAAPAEPAASADAAPTPLGQVLLTDSGQIQKIYASANTAPAASLKDNGAKSGDAIAKGIRDAAMKLPPGMKPDGPLATGNLKEKQHLQTDVTLQPGKCYSIVGFSKKVKDLDLYLFVPPGVLSGQDLTDDNKPIIGGPPQPMCPVGASAITYKLDIFADSGAGDVGVQLFSKGN
jgi:hypothetical protein